MADPRYYLTGALAEIAEVAGLPAALAVAERYGGSRLYVPKRAPDSHELVQLVGRDAADAICRFYGGLDRGGEPITIPLGPRRFYARARAAAEKMRAEGKSVAEVTRALGVARSSVFAWTQESADGGDDKQGSLF
jgi:hypothetical protein